ncbi:MAG: class I SAM-dependent methyltransferase [Nitrospirae bacterium]|nr:class I SAM-dependent methyltransferase [Nitrospirota bacterium]
MSRRTINLDNRIYHYLLDASLREHPVLAALREHTATLPDARMQIAPEQGQFMALLARLIGAETCLEVGTFTGYSALAVALALPEHGRVLCCELDSDVITTARHFWQRAEVSDRIEVLLGEALRSLDELLADGRYGHFDFAFIDADKANYEEYYERILNLVRPGGLICVDNVLWSGRVADPDHHDPATQALRTFNAHRRNDRRVDLSLVPIGDGLTLCRKK